MFDHLPQFQDPNENSSVNKYKSLRPVGDSEPVTEPVRALVMQGVLEGDVRTMPAPSYIPLGETLLNANTRNPYRHTHRQTSQGSNYYSKTKRKRDSSSCSGRSDSPPSADVPAPPPWHNPVYPYSRGIIG